ncbi:MULTISPECIES: flagellar basal-body MS-ring/collar protein FliF [Rhizobium/Agrobacterium group]|jgi:flagellar M-ring protein FliF|uniref:flagellar basal-body MS-ring/collar protein FliF n=1 Tax=Rhizobium/Agrobacterium group TaxID=227290 RepID=UPI000714ACE8|nr:MULTISPECIES: flagellar basal-body MS-ring/collar protein FliF [Rhizobium/Agrobacterium group]RYE70478.1 MAG: flagellar M-ring protein FliF [Rhizobiaceae bacterium]KQQ73682.1 flagellar M-ring protein FliF [Rhizobium sp. Leaf321]MBD8664764.1 flagellar M-ring protein FliF [Rhizobium sp. CFBP 8752]NSY16199.1 flagellar M-ring protein FliF [Neorhizobium sp. AL 9.2.2]SEH23407.1 flagellar M-ring protein FliF [Rhizobium sp. NFR12]
MNLLSQFPTIFKNLASLGQTRLIALGAVGVVSIAIVLAAALYVNKPSYEGLYVGLETADLNQISIALAEANMPFEVGSDGASIQVPVGMTGKARLMLAERGLPNSANAGYELFDNVGSLGLTSFMQEVTRVRALEGEIGRSIQQISGVSAARVHIVMPDAGNFRRGEQKPTASVMIRANASAGRKAAASIRHLVASAVPGLEVDDVTILDSTGQLLASGDDGSNSQISRSLGVVQSVQQEIENNIDKALAPFLGMDNFRSSVTAALNTDSQQIQETVFDPNSRVERSVRSTKEASKSQQAQNDSATTVEQNVPQAAPQAGGDGAPKSSDQSDKKEEQTNYEINQKTTATVRNGYQIEKISIAVVVNKGRIAKMVGEPADQAKVDAYLAEMQKIVSSAAGISSDRGDVVTLTAMDFVETQLLDEAASSGPGMMEVLNRNIGGIINSLAFVLVAFLVVWLGLRPLVRTVGGNTSVPAGELTADAAGLELPDFSPGGASPALMDGFGADFGFDSSDDLMGGADDGGFNRRVKEGPEKRLSRMVEISEERAAKILRKWAIDKAA